MKTPEPNSIERRLRLLLAREFAARRYYLDAEGFFDGESAETLTAAELELMGCVAAQRGDWTRAEKRFEVLAEKCTASEPRTQAREFAAYAREMASKPKPPAKPSAEGRDTGIHWLVLTSALVGAVVAILILLACGVIALPVKQ